ncbi:MAG: cob(I)yrinic acid a,c-diamide adenosyltransferase [Acetobacteraceae bacterium]|nr:cob(I)yrinic acid a,c-diamide adenosyltransferase [Acetobacteraceae bacterium]
MVRIDRITTRGGDRGQTSLADGSRVSKADLRIEAIGAVDEANAAIGLLRRATGDEPAIDAVLGRIQHDLFDLGADIATPRKENEAEGQALRIVPDQLARLEAEIASFNAALPPLRSFVLPGGTEAAARAHLARTVTRRAERALARLGLAEALNPDALKFLNRLSDLLFVLCRVLNAAGAEDVLWAPGANR